MQTISIEDEQARAVVVPALGAGLARYDLKVADRLEPLFRPCTDVANAGPIDLANFNMLPFSNRISGGGFSLEGRFHALEPNLLGQKFPIHGSGFLLPWHVMAQSPTAVTLAVEANGPGPFQYSATFTYSLENGALTMAMAMVNRAAIRLPYGGGFHPWLPREPGLTLEARNQRIVIKSDDLLPIGDAPVADYPDRDFTTPISFPDTLLDTDYLGWDGIAVVRWSQRGLRLVIDARDEPKFRTCVIYSPGKQANFFCFEPVTHASDAFNLPGGMEANGLVLLPPGEQLAVSCVFRPSIDR